MNNILFITGASSDLGIELIRSVKEECLILAHYNSSDAAIQEVAKEITNKVITIQADLSSEQAIRDLTDHISTTYGTPGKIVHLAAARVSNIRFKDLSWDDFEKDMSISLKSLVIILNRFIPQLAKEKRGRIVVMLSSYVFGIPPKALAHYTTVKYALLGLVKSLASEYGDKHITINAVSPSMIETKFLSNINEMIVEATAHANPLKRNATVKDVVPAINFLLSDEAVYINGANIPVTAGSIS